MDLYARRYHWPTHMELPNMHAHTYEDTPTHIQQKEKKAEGVGKRRKR